MKTCIKKPGSPAVTPKLQTQAETGGSIFEKSLDDHKIVTKSS